MKGKRGISDVITTVLIILLVLAAIVIVWQAVKGTVTKSADAVTTQTECITLDLSAVSAVKSVNNINVSVTRGGDSIAGTSITVTATCADGNSISNTTATVAALGTTKVIIPCGAVPGSSTTVRTALKTTAGATCTAAEETFTL